MNKKIVSAGIISALMLPMTVNAEYNPYNEESYVNPSNLTLEEVAEEFGFGVDDYKAKYNLPEDMAGDTNESAAYAYVTVEKIAEANEIDLETWLEKINSEVVSGVTVTKDTPYGGVEGSISLAAFAESYMGMSFSDFKEMIGVSDLNPEDPYSKIKPFIDRYTLMETNALSYFNVDDILIMLKGKYLDLNVAPRIMENRTMVPMRDIFEALGASVNWDGETKTIFATKEDNVIIMQVGQDVMFVNGEKVQIDSPSIIVEDRTLVPARAIAEAFGMEVGYNAETKTVIIH